MKLRLLEVAESARLEPLQYQIEGLRGDAGPSRERILHGPDGEQCQGDHCRRSIGSLEATEAGSSTFRALSAPLTGSSSGLTKPAWTSTDA